MEGLLLPAMAGAVLFGAVVRWPLLGACLFLLCNPLIVGIARGEFAMFMRPNEALLLFLLAAMAVRLLLLLLGGRLGPTAMDRMDVALLLLVLTGSVLPLLWQGARGVASSLDDALYAVVMVKYYALFRLFRAAVRDEQDVQICLRVALFAAAVVAVLAMLQVSHLLGVAEFLLTYYDQPFEGHADLLTERATSTIASSFGLGDLMIVSLVTALALRRIAGRGRWLLSVSALLFLLGCVAAGSFSGYIGLAVALLSFGLLTGSLHRLVPVAAAAAPVAALFFWPVVEKRLEGFERPSGLPHSWEGRLENLRRFFLPDLMSGNNWLLGVQPAPRVPAPETWRSMVYIESGYIWLLWIGGIPFLLAFLWFVGVGLAHLRQVAALRADAVGSAALASFCALLVVVALMLFDPHLTVRGGADILFPMLALSLAPRGAAGASAAAVARTSPPAALPNGWRRMACEP
ncbi:hypothetical protein D9599_07685 [Roseomonas sp. KE2513]|uniref:hypothetical protein n=1 Tax=Roseomonas sp. KE2513 TaxID=2479202 RepID=UPI0018DFA43D|nr:hypothetical protein [Roseomonas sp. KE2513]MBI0535448.1 hypothetical protein [Roseomonas sp. KE2513]